MGESKRHFLIVDDYAFNSMIAEKMIKSIDADTEVKTFLYAAEALEYVTNNDFSDVIILIDIQMPYMSGFQFLDAFEQLPEEKRKNYAIYIYSSTVNEADMKKAASYESVKRFIPKPLTYDTLKTILGKQEA